MYCRNLLVSLIILSMQFTVCTGGLMFIPDAIAAGPLSHDDSFAAMSIPSCLSEVQSHEVVTHTPTGGCKDADSCIIQSQHLSVSRAVLLITQQPSDAHASSLSPNYVPPNSHPATFLLARAGPIFEQAASLSRTLLKRE